MKLSIFAGQSAYDHIKKHGLSPSDIDAVLGASGSAKWLSIYGLDLAIYAEWFQNRKRPLNLFGTSIGAWKFAAAAQKNPREAFKRLMQAYIHQFYPGRVTPEKISKESSRVMRAFLSDDNIDDILSHPFMRIGFSAVRCKNILAVEAKILQLAAAGVVFSLNLASRDLQKLFYERVLFHDVRYNKDIFDFSGFPTKRVRLERENFFQALLASGSIPVVMPGVTKIPGAPAGVYRDGGLLDYHPALPLKKERTGFILYPHFYPDITPGWFDKKNPGRKAASPLTDRMILLCPSSEYTSLLPGKRIPDRNDFIRFKGRDHDRISAWSKAVQMSMRLGEQFLEIVTTGSIKNRVKMLM